MVSNKKQEKLLIYLVFKSKLSFFIWKINCGFFLASSNGFFRHETQSHFMKLKDINPAVRQLYML